MSTRRLRKRGTTILLKTLVGVIIGLMILVFLVLLVRPFLSGINTRQQKAFDELHEKLVTIAKASPYSNDRMLLDLEEEYAIIGFGPVQGGSNGRYSNGEFFYNVDKKDDKQDSKTYAFTREPMYLDRKKTRACEDNQACLCLCKKPSSLKIEDEDPTQIDIREVDTAGSPNPYDSLWIASWSEEDKFKKRYNYNTKDKRLRELQCKELSCSPIEGLEFLSVAPCGCYYSEQKVEENVNKDCDYVFENGFAIYRRKEDISKGQSVAYEEKLPASVQVIMGKLPNGQVMVSLRERCIEEMETIMG